MNADLLSHLEPIGAGDAYVDDIAALAQGAVFFADFERDDIDRLARYMRVYRAQAGQAIIRESDEGDFMFLLIAGSVDIFKTSVQGDRQLMTSVGAGATLGEMSMFDGEPRFATCIATDTSTVAVLSRDDMAKIILEDPALGAKMLVELVAMLSQRLRHTSARLMRYLAS